MNDYLKSLIEYGNNPTSGKDIDKSRDVAVIGMWGGFGSAENPNLFWKSLCEGKDLSREFPLNRREDTHNFMRMAGTLKQDVQFKQASYVDSIDQFDYSFFGISPKEACLMDPSQRIFLQTVWNAIEDSGYSIKSLVGKDVGIYTGYTDDMTYKHLVHLVDPESISMAIPGNLRSMIGGRIAHLLDLHGPSVVVDTACSSALVAAHSACRAIQCGDCEMAIVGSVKIFLEPLEKDVQFLDSVMSKDERTRSYDAQANGFGLGEGTGAIILKTLGKAIEDQDNIYAVIKGSAITHDGTSIGLTAPNVRAQEDTIRRAWREAGICADEMDYVEGHGTATALGDAVELQALGNMLGTGDKNKKCILSSVKSNIGHLDHAAGIAGLIKLLLMLKHKQVPPTVHFKKPNNIILSEKLPIQIKNEAEDWQSDERLRTCCISSFGMSGTNCHMVLQEYYAQPVETENPPVNLFTLSAKTQEALASLVQSYIDFLQEETDISIDEVCYTANVGRDPYEFRLSFPCESKKDLLHSLENMLDSGYVNSLKAVGEKICREIQEDCTHLIDKWNKGHDIGLLKKISELFCKGATIAWNGFYNKKIKRVSLPVYPFAKTRCWCEASDTSIYHALVWEEQKLGGEGTENGETQNMVVLGPDSEFVSKLSKIIKDHDKLVALGEFGGRRSMVPGESKCSICNEEELSAFTGNINWKQVTHVLYCLPSVAKKNEWSPEVAVSLEYGVYSVFKLIKKMLKESISKCQLIIIGSDTYNISDTDTALHPENAASYGLGRVVCLEYPHIFCRCFDISSNTEAYDVYNVVSQGDANTFLVALRNHKRYTQKLRVSNKHEQNTNVAAIKKDGVYVITGGIGELGLKVCQLLGEYEPAHIVLISRTRFPPRQDWGGMAKNTQDGILSRIDVIREIEKRRTKVSVYCADVSNETEMTHTINTIIAEYGRIDGVIHCAGIAGDGFIINKAESVFREVLSPKVEGTWLLHALTKRCKPDFFILFSSVTVITGAPGQSDYCAANSYLDAFAEYRNQLGLRTLSIAWTKWKDTGIGANFEFDQDRELFFPIEPVTAQNALVRIWNSNAVNIIIGQVNPRYSFSKNGSLTIGQAANRFTKLTEGSLLPTKSYVDEAISLSGKADGGGYTYYEKLIATIWRDVLGYATFSIHDSFFDIGGDSLKLRRVYKHIEDRLPGRTTIVDLFTYSSIFQLARFVDDSGSAAVKEDDLTTKLQDLVSGLKKDARNMDEIIERYNNLS